MNILHIYKDYFPVLGGIETYIKILAEAQASSGHTVTVLVCNQGLRTQTEYINGVTILKTGRLATVASMPLSIIQPIVLSSLHPDLTHLHSPYPLGELANWMLGRSKNTVIAYHSDIVRQKGWLTLYGPFLRRILTSAGRIIVSSPYYLEKSPWLRPIQDKCRIIPYGVDTTRFTPSPNKETGKSFRLLFVGRLRYYKGLETLFHALSSVPDVHLAIIGDGPMRKNWEALSGKLGLGQKVQFVGEVQDKDLPLWYHRADLFVLPSNARSEAFGIVLLEAMASGLPCITTELGTRTSWVVQNKKTGLVIPPGDPETLARSILTLIENPTWTRALGEAGRKRVEEHFSLQGMIEQVETLYREVVQTKSTNRKSASWGCKVL